MKNTTRLIASLFVFTFLALTGSLGLSTTEVATDEDVLELRPFTLPEACQAKELWDEWYEAMWEEHGPGAAVPLKLIPTDEHLDRMGLPPREILENNRFPVPTLVLEDGRMIPVELPAVPKDMPTTHELGVPGPLSGEHGWTGVTFAGTGCFGIRPGALLLNLNEGVAICSMAHVLGSEGRYKITTAGHCTKGNDILTVVAAVGDLNGVGGVVLFDFGKTAKSTGDGGIGHDSAVISIYSHAQDLVSPTMCVWGGPRGVYDHQGAIISADLGRNWLDPSLSVDPDPNYAQAIVHYGHGLGLGPGGTARAGVSQFWGDKWFAFYGAISPGDSGSGSNTGLGEAVGINTHIILIDPPRIANSMGALMAGTRITAVGDPADGQIVPYPIPAPGLP